MDQIKVNVPTIELSQTLVERTKGIVISVVGIPKLGGDEYLFPWEATFLDRLSNTLLVSICGCCIDEAVAGFKSCMYRSFDLFSPFPEEANGKLTSQITSLHLAPTATSKANLLAEALPEANIVVTGNTVIDALLHTVEKQLPFTDPALVRIETALGLKFRKAEEPAQRITPPLPPEPG